MEYDLEQIMNEELSPTSARRRMKRVNKIAGRLSQGGRAVLVDRLDQLDPLVEELERRRDAAPEGQKPFHKVVSIHSPLPKDQEKKLVLLEEMVDRLGRAKKRGLITDKRYAEISKHLPAELKAITMHDLPEMVSR